MGNTNADFHINKDKGFCAMSNYHLRDKTLTHKAKGLLSMMFDFPEDWDYTIAGLVSISVEGRDSIMATLKELESRGYLIRSRSRDERGRMGRMHYEVFSVPQPAATPESLENTAFHPESDFPTLENPTLDNPTLDNPTLGKPTLEKPSTENPTQLNINKLNINKSNTNLINDSGDGGDCKKESKKGAADGGDAAQPRQSYDEIIDEMILDERVRFLMREFVKTQVSKKEGRYLRNSQLKLLIQKLQIISYGDPENQKAIIARTLRNGWKDFFELPGDVPPGMWDVDPRDQVAVAQAKLRREKLIGSAGAYALMKSAKEGNE